MTSLAGGAIALVLGCAGCQLIMDDLPSKQAHEDGGDADAGDVDADSGDSGDGPEMDATDDRDAVSVDAETDASAEPDAAEEDASEEDAEAPMPDADARTPDPEPCDGAAQSTFYRDSDKDGYGDPSMAMAACEAPAGYVENDDDCSDGNADAHPGQPQFFTTGYSVPGTSVRSFDYDCDTNERGEPGALQHEACSSGLLGCTGNGYKQDPTRANMGDVNPYCGSDVFVNCGTSGLLACGPTPMVSGQPFACN